MTSRVGGSPFISPWINPSKAVKSDRCGGWTVQSQAKINCDAEREVFN